ncbi:MAPEG family protein [Thalassolituus alkanivorans]|uniref:MAPEG family protein n=1 Tax=Thalassolituus alkanivorans TaxID=2881055 RepID=UPI001E566BAD|nr:MAPEG family protein [Thalassolituus alkanivorans]MBU2039054.1 MAPEG family protein [Gammaproteobacteria bacterium]MCB2388707.1 MAPEG family protein [Thalassolituus alkanivorans]MCB2424787.1 MAPEG family protein [Thalassolituus alkanivorans]
MIAPLYIAIFSLMFTLLSFRVIRLRQTARVAIGDGGDKALRRAIRVHGNFAEYVPLALILIFAAESLGMSAVWIHGLCLALLIGRLLHAYGVSQVKEPLLFRQLALSINGLVMIIASVWLITRYL